MPSILRKTPNLNRFSITHYFEIRLTRSIPSSVLAGSAAAAALFLFLRMRTVILFPACGDGCLGGCGSLLGSALQRGGDSALPAKLRHVHRVDNGDLLSHSLLEYINTTRRPLCIVR